MAKTALSVDNVFVSYHIVNSFKFRRARTELKGKTFERFYALKEISFELEEGLILGVIGRNGSGKSTILKTIAGIFSPDSGSINLHENRVSLLALGVGFQSSLSGYDNIFLSGMLLGITKKEIQEKLDGIIEFSELEDFIYKPIGTYSSGMISKLAFSISSTLDTDILLIDEVFSVGDIAFKKKSLERVHKLISDKSKTVLIVSHDIEMIRGQCDKAIWLDAGRIIEYGDTNKTIDAYVNYMESPKAPLKNKDNP